MFWLKYIILQKGIFFFTFEIASYALPMLSFRKQYEKYRMKQLPLQNHVVNKTEAQYVLGLKFMVCVTWLACQTVKVSIKERPKFLWHFCVKEKEKEMKIIEQKHKGKIIFKKDY